MCDINSEERKKRYKTLRNLGYTRGWAQRARDFTDIRYIQALNGGKRPSNAQIKKLKTQKPVYKPSCVKCDGGRLNCICIRPSRELWLTK